MAQVKTTKVYVHQVEPGMYVSGLDRPWLETPFYLQGFMVRNTSEVQKLALYCDYVYVDYNKSIANFEVAVAHKIGHDRKLGVAETPFDKELATRRITKYSEQIAVTSEIKIANRAYQNIREEFDGMASRINEGKSLNIANLSEVVNPLVDSIIRNPGASIWLAKFKSQNSYTYRHCLAVAIWCAVIGRQIGLPKKELALLSTGGMLLDIGKLKIPGQILNKKDQLTEREFSLIKKHVDLSLKMASESSRTIAKPVIDMIAYHHERFNGNGYPHALQGTQIPLYARIAAIADCYDAITSQRVYAHPIAHAKALKKMYEWRGYDFQPELIEAFIQSVGVYPTGTLVELTSGEVGIVIKENAGKRLRPHVLVILDRQKNQLEDFVEMDLFTHIGADNRNIDIARTLEAGAYGLDPEALYI